MEFQRTPLLEIDQRRRLVGAHGHRAGQFGVGIAGVDGVAEGGGDGNGFQHQLPEQGAPFRVPEQVAGGPDRFQRTCRVDLATEHRVQSSRGGHPQPVERDVPNQLLPVGAEDVLRHLAGNSGLPEPFGDPVGARLRRTSELPEHDPAVVDVPDQPGRIAVDADEAQAAHHLLDREEGLQGLLVAQAILEGEHSRPRVHQGGKQFGEGGVGRGLQPDEDEVDRADLRRRPGAAGADVEVPLRTENPDALVADRLEIGAEQEGHVGAGPGQHRAVIAPQRPASDDGDLHRRSIQSAATMAAPISRVPTRRAEVSEAV